LCEQLLLAKGVAQPGPREPHGLRASLAPSASRGWEWKPDAPGTYTITVTLECYCFDNRVQPPVRISLGTDTDTRNVVVTSI